jgi:hypothetical protein
MSGPTIEPEQSVPEWANEHFCGTSETGAIYDPFFGCVTPEMLAQLRGEREVDFDE